MAPLSIEYSYPNGSTFSAGQVEAWELKASRRALLNLKTLLQGRPMLDLLRPQMEEADAYYKKLIAASNGEYQEACIHLKVKGVTMQQFIGWLTGWIDRMKSSREDKDQVYLNTIMPAHPEHYSFSQYPVGIVETIGGYVARVRNHTDDRIPDFVLAYGDPSYSSVPMIGSLEDGIFLFYVLHEFRDAEDGCDVIARILFPAAAPKALFDEHSQHLSVAFTSFISQAFESQQHRQSDATV